MGGQRDPLGHGPHPPVAVGPRGHRPGAPVRFRHPARKRCPVPASRSRVYGIVDCGSLLWYLQNTRIIQILGTGYYHPVLPLIPRADCDEQLARWHGIARNLFARTSFAGFWPPEMGFCMELIPALKRQGYRYVLVDSEHVEPVTPMGWDELRYRPHVARFGDDEIIVVVRDRELSDAQEAGMETGWFVTRCPSGPSTAATRRW